MGFSQALSGLNSAATNLDVIGNNIANSQTVGFKGSSTQFADVFAGAQAGLGTRVAAVVQDFSTGTLESTGRNMDLAIDGDGFFRLIQNDQVVYSRNGQMSLNADGYIVNAQGARLTGFPAGVQAGGNAEEIQVPSGAMQANASTAVEATLNLDANVDVIDRAGATPVTFDPANSDTYSYANNVTLFDSLGRSHNTTMYFTKTAVNSWEVRMSRAGEEAPEVGTLEFDTNGVVSATSPAMPDFSFDFDDGGVDEVTDMSIALDLGSSTQFGEDFELSAIDQDGYSSGSLIGVTIDDLGNVVGSYSNEQSSVLATIAMTNFSNTGGLNPIGDNVWAETTDSGQPLMGLAGSGRFGSIKSGVVENSNVDLTKELVNLIIAQRNYQANSQTIKVQDEVLQSAVNLR